MINHYETLLLVILENGLILLEKRQFFRLIQAVSTSRILKSIVKTSNTSESKGVRDMKARNSKTAAKAVALSRRWSRSRSNASFFFSNSSSVIFLNLRIIFMIVRVGEYDPHFLTRNQTSEQVVYNG